MHEQQKSIHHAVNSFEKSPSNNIDLTDSKSHRNIDSAESDWSQIASLLDSLCNLQWWCHSSNRAKLYPYYSWFQPQCADL